MIPVAEAIQIVRRETRKLPTESVSLEHARGRFLAEDVVADSESPALRSLADGWLRGASRRRREPACETQSRW